MVVDRAGVLPLMLAPATVFRELLYRPDSEVSGRIGERFEIIARPGEVLTERPRSGDVLLSVTLGCRGGGECGLLTDPGLSRQGRGGATGWYCIVSSSGGRHRRRILDLTRRVPPGCLLLRQREDIGESAETISALICPLFADDPELGEVLAGRLRLAARGTPNHPAPVRSEGTAVRKVQLALIAVGHTLPSGADGKFGAETGRAVVQFKTARGIAPNDPVVGPKTISALDDVCRQKSPSGKRGYRIAASGRNTGPEVSAEWTAAILNRYLPDEEAAPGDVRVSVVGGGFAGLMAAWSLQSGGFNVTLFEARGQLGGRVRTDRSMIKGQIVEAGAELIGENHPTWIMLAKKFNLHRERISTDDDYAKQKLRTRVILGGHELTKQEKDDVERKLDTKILAIMGNEAKTVPPLEPWTAKSAPRWDDISVWDRLNEPDMFDRQSDLARQYLEFTVENDNCVPVNEHSYLALLAAISAGRVGDNMLGYWTHTETHRCAGGNDQLATHLAKGIKNIRLNSAVESITLATATRVTYRRPDGQHHEAFDYVILAAPPRVWPRVESTPPFDSSKYTVSHGPAVKFISSFATPFWTKHGLAPVTKSDRIGSVWEATDKQRPARGYGLAVYSGGRCVLTAADYSSRLDNLYPDYLKNRLAYQLVDWPNEPFIMSGYAAPRRGEVMSVVKNLNGSFQNRIFFAGEQVSPGFFGYMEGALQSGLHAAGRVAVAARRDRSLHDTSDAVEQFSTVGVGEG